MAYGVEFYNSLGQKSFDSAWLSPCLIGVFTTPAGTNGGGSASFTFPNYAGATIQITITGQNSYTAQSSPTELTIDYALGYPRVNCPNFPSGLWNSSIRRPPATCYVYLISPPTNVNTSYGFYSQSNLTNSDPVLYTATSNLHFIGKATYTGISQINPQFYTGYMVTYTIACIQQPVVFIRDGSGAASSVAYVTFNGTSATIGVISNGTQPVLYCFNPLSGAGSIIGYGMEIFKADGTVGLSTEKKPLICPAYVNYVFAGSGIRDAGRWPVRDYQPNSTLALSVVGTLPTYPAILASTTFGFTGETQHASGNYGITYCASSMYLTGSTYYSNNIKLNGSISSFDTLFPQTYNAGYTYRAFVIDTTLYD